MSAAIKRFGRTSNLLKTLAFLRTWQHRIGDAVTLYREMLTKDPKDVVALNNLAMLLALQGEEYNEAEKLVREARAGHESDPSLLDTWALVLMAEGKRQEAIEHARPGDRRGRKPRFLLPSG